MSKDTIASLRYLDFGDMTTENSNVRFVPGTPEIIHDASKADNDFSLDRQGFQWVYRPTAMSPEDFRNNVRLSTVYHSEVRDLLKGLTKADHIWIFSSRVGRSGSLVRTSAHPSRAGVLLPTAPIDRH